MSGLPPSLRRTSGEEPRLLSQTAAGD